MKEHICEICGRKNFHQLKADGKVVCEKHQSQWKKYGKFLDNNPRTIYDLNEYHIKGNITYIDLYDKHCNKIAETMIDTEDLPKVQYTKWKLSASGYAQNTPKYKGKNKHMSKVILGTDEMVDHINHNKLDNRKCNLRIVNKSQNAMNSYHKGIDENSNGTFTARIKLHQHALNLGTYMFENEALFAHWYAEQLLFGEYAYPKEKPIVVADRESEIRDYVCKKVQRL